MTKKEGEEEEVVVPMSVEAVPVAETTGAPDKEGQQQQLGASPPIPPGHSRFYCSKCHAVSHLNFILYDGDEKEIIFSFDADMMCLMMSLQIAIFFLLARDNM